MRRGIEVMGSKGRGSAATLYGFQLVQPVQSV